MNGHDAALVLHPMHEALLAHHKEFHVGSMQIGHMTGTQGCGGQARSADAIQRRQVGARCRLADQRRGDPGRVAAEEELAGEQRREQQKGHQRSQREQRRGNV